MASTAVRSAVVVATLAALAACGGGGGGKKATIGTKGWTVLVYMTADNNLEGDGMRDLLEMASVGSGENLRFVVQADRAVGEYTGPVLNQGDWTSTKRLLVRKGSLEVLSDLGELDMGLTASLADFVQWGVKTYPGERYMLVFWDHGGGWKGFGWDDSHVVGNEPSHLTLDRIRDGVSQGLSQSGTGVTKFDVIGFDACLMATLEVAVSMQPYASYLLASEEVEPGHGWDWAAFGGGGLLDPVALGTKVIDGFYAQADSAPWKDAADVTLSLVDLSKLGPIQAAITSLAGTYGSASAVAPVLGKVAEGRRAAMEYAANPDPAQAYSLVDMVDLFDGMTGVTGVAAVKAAVVGAVVVNKFGAAKVGSNGLSIFFPPDGPLPPGYVALPGMDAWRTFLGAVYGGGNAQLPPTFATAASSSDAAGLTLSGTLTDATNRASLASATLSYGLSDGATGSYLLGDWPATVTVGGTSTSVSSTWDWTSLLVIQGATTEYGYLSLEQVSATLFAANIPFWYEEPGASAYAMSVWRIVFDSAGTVQSNNVYLYSGGGVAELAPVAGSRLYPVVLYMPNVAAWASDWVRADGGTGTGFDATVPLDLDLPRWETGVLCSPILRVENAVGDGDWVYLTSPVPVPAP